LGKRKADRRGKGGKDFGFKIRLNYCRKRLPTTEDQTKEEPTIKNRQKTASGLGKKDRENAKRGRDGVVPKKKSFFPVNQPVTETRAPPERELASRIVNTVSSYVRKDQSKRGSVISFSTDLPKKDSNYCKKAKEWGLSGGKSWSLRGEKKDKGHCRTSEPVQKNRTRKNKKSPRKDGSRRKKPAKQTQKRKAIKGIPPVEN